MMRVSTSFSHYSALLHIQQGQSRVNQYLEQVGTGRLGGDLKSFAAQAETLMASRQVQLRTEAHLATNHALSARLLVQDEALSKVQKGAEAALAAVNQALASNDGSALLDALQAAMDEAAGGLNTSYSGSYLFSGGHVDTPPVAILKLEDLDDPPPPPPDLPTPRPNPFANGNLPGQHRVDDDTLLTTGLLADELASPLFDALADVAALPPAGSGEPLTGDFGAPLTAEQHEFLQGLMSKLSAAATHVTTLRASNGALQARVEATTTDLTERKAMLEGLLADVTAADPLEAAARLDAARTSLQAAAEAFNALKESSLLNILRR